MSKRILKNLAELIFVSVMFIVVAVLSVRGGLGIMADLAEMDTPPDAGPPCASMEQFIGVWQDEFQEGNGMYRDSRVDFIAELNRRGKQGYVRAYPSGSIGGTMALMECGEASE